MGNDPPQGDALSARNPRTVVPLISPWRAGVLLKRRISRRTRVTGLAGPYPRAPGESDTKHQAEPNS